MAKHTKIRQEDKKRRSNHVVQGDKKHMRAAVKPLPPAQPRRQPATLADICVRSTGERIMRLRTLAELTLEQAAQASDISRAELSRLENGTRKLTDLHLTRLARAYGLALSDLKAILDYHINSHLRVAPVTKPQTVQETKLRFCHASEFSRKGEIDPRTPKKISTPFSGELSAQAYAVILNTPHDAFFAPNALIISDPERQVRLGDLVMNTVGRDPIMVRLHRDAHGSLWGTYGNVQVEFGKSVALKSFHKIVAILTSTESVTSISS